MNNASHYHNDIKLDNITLLNNKAYLIDFGFYSNKQFRKNYDDLLRMDIIIKYYEDMLSKRSMWNFLPFNWLGNKKGGEKIGEDVPTPHGFLQKLDSRMTDGKRKRSNRRKTRRLKR